MHLHLLVPALLWPEAPAPRLPALELLLARARRSEHTNTSAQAWLCDAFNLEHTGDIPVAPYSLLADGGEPNKAYWLRADPVHLRIQRDHLLLADASMFAITREEADALAESLNRHFSTDNFELQALQPERWYLRLSAAPALRTVPLASAVGRSVDENLPQGDDAPAWHARLNEIQMLLHEHPVNEAREARGEMPVNSLWFWGGGVCAALEPASFGAVWSNDAFARGLALATKARALTLPESAEALLTGAPTEGIALAQLDALASISAYGDTHAWNERLIEMEARWFTPLLAALREKRIGMLTLHAFGAESGISFECARDDLLRFWRRPRPLAYYAKP